MSKECETCDSTSMEMCLLIRKCPHWLDKPNESEEVDNDNRHRSNEQ